jgi:hypothetical protein
MAYQAATVGLLKYLRNNPAVRSQVRAGPDRTLLYSGSFMRPMWAEIEMQRQMHAELRDKQTLPDVLKQIAAPAGSGCANLLAHVQQIERQVPWQPDGFTVWRALSGLFAANAVGKVSFQIGGGITPDTKVFASTEVNVLMRNPRVDSVTKDLLAYYLRCIQSKNADMNVGFISA